MTGVSGQVVIGNLVRRAAFTRRDRGNAGLGPRLIIGRIAHHVHAVPLPGGELHEWPESAWASCGIRAMPGGRRMQGAVGPA